MKVKYYYLFIMLVKTEILLIILLLENIYTTRNVVQINPISQHNVLSAGNSDLLHYYESSPSSTITYKPSWSPRAISHLITKDTLNERFEYSTIKPQNVKRIIALGDSFTYGLYVNTEETWSEQLEELLNNNLLCSNYKNEVINLGMTGYDARYAAIRYKRRGQQYNPNIIIWYIKDDDLEEIRDLTYPIVEEYVREQKKLPENSSKSEVELYEQGYYKAKIELEKSYDKSSIREYHQESFSIVASSFIGKIYVVNGFNYSDESEKLLKNVQDTFHNIIVLRNLLAEYPINSTTNSPFDSHLSRLGHQIIAEKLYKKLAEDTYCST